MQKSSVVVFPLSCFVNSCESTKLVRATNKTHIGDVMGYLPSGGGGLVANTYNRAISYAVLIWLCWLVLSFVFADILAIRLYMQPLPQVTYEIGNIIGMIVSASVS